MTKRRRSLKEAHKADGEEPKRTCIATGEVCAAGDLVRFVLDPNGVLTPDLSARLPGRGAWVRADRAAVEKAASKGLFMRAFKGAIKMPEGMTPVGLADAVEQGLEARALSSLGLARRSGELASGFDKAKTALGGAKAAALICASDAANDGVAKLSRLARNIPIVRAFTVEQQSQATGRAGATHMVVNASVGADRFLREALRLSGFRPVFEERAVMAV